MKTIKLLTLVLATIFVFSACSMSDNASNEAAVSKSVSNEIQLTTENASQYLTFELHGYPTDYSYGTYKKVAANGNISGIPGYTYNNVTVELSFSYSYTYGSRSDSCVITASSDLNLAGNGTVSVEETAKHNGTNVVAYMSDCECDGYTITSVTGTVTKN